MQSQRRWLRWVLPFAFWSIPPAFIMAYALHEAKVSAWRLFLTEGLPWYYLAAVTNPIIALAKRYPLESLRHWRGRVVHLSAALLVGLGQCVFALLLQFAFGTEMADRPLHKIILSALVFFVLFGMVFYSGVASIGFTLGYQERLREREMAASRLEAKLVEAQLGALRMQLQPHFLFNTLNVVAMHVRDGDQTTSVRLLARLSEMLRHLLDDGGAQEVPLATELEQARRYLDIESVRFSDRMRVRYDVPPELMTAFVPNLLLQPLVENAVRHGIAARANAGGIEITAARKGERLQVVVRNEGPHLQNGWSAESSTGIGLRNTTLRLQHLYGANARIHLENWDGGVQVNIELPWHTRPVNHEPA